MTEVSVFAQTSLVAPATTAVTPVTSTAGLMPRHGTISTAPATRWEDALAAGNGIMGALDYGDPVNDTVVIDHCKCWLPLGSREIVPNVGYENLLKMRQIIGLQGYGAGQNFFLDQARKTGWHNLVWTDPFHPGFFLNLTQPQTGPFTDFARIEDFARGVVWTQWKTPNGFFMRKMFVSKTDNVVVVTTTGPAGQVSMNVGMQDLGNSGIAQQINTTASGITCHNTYVKGKGGYDGDVRVVHVGGTQTSDGKSIAIAGADSVTLILRIQPWKVPLDGSEAWEYTASNPDFHRSDQTAGLYRAAATYNPEWLTQLTDSVGSLSPDFDHLLQPHEAAWSSIYNRVSIDLGGDPAQRAMSSEELLTLAENEKSLPPALLERMYDAGRYVFMCSAGPQTPPNLFGIWTGTWAPAWSGDYTTDTNVQLDVECAYSANMAECMAGYFNLWDSYVPDFQTNATNMYGCRGILTGSRASNNGLDLHFDGGWVGNLWTPGAPWLAHWYYDYYEYTGDKTFLRDRAIPFMEQCALFYEDFLKGTEDVSGHYMFRPSFSAENGTGDNSSQDIEIATQLLTNLINGCETLGIKQDDVIRWKAMLAKLPPLLINDQGQLKEWSNPTQGEKNNHRHLMHLYGAFDGQQFSPEQDPIMYAAAKVALLNRVNASQEDATHGFMHTGLAATELGMGNLAYARIAELSQRRSIFLNMVDGHYGGPRVLCDDGNGATPEIVDRMIVQSKPGRLMLLPALPDSLPNGSLSGSRARGAILMNRVAWNTADGTLSAVITADGAQTTTLVLPPGAAIESVTVDGKKQTVSSEGVDKMGFLLKLPKGKPVTVDAKLKFAATAGIN